MSLEVFTLSDITDLLLFENTPRIVIFIYKEVSNKEELIKTSSKTVYSIVNYYVNYTKLIIYYYLNKGIINLTEIRMKFNSTGFLLLVSLTALNDDLDSFLQFHVNFRAHCRAQTIFENLNTILKVLEKITMERKTHGDLDVVEEADGSRPEAGAAAVELTGNCEDLW